MVKTPQERVPSGYMATEVGVIPKDWQVKKIGELLKVRHGRSQKGVEVEDGQYPILATGGEIGRTNEYLFSKPSVLIGRKGTIDKPRYITTPFWTVDTLFYTEIFKDAIAKFIFYKFNVIDWYSFNEASGVPSLSAKIIENIDISVPPSIAEQAKIAETITDFDESVSLLEMIIAKKRNMKTGTMQQLLTGRKRLNGFSGAWSTKKLGELLSYEQPTRYLVRSTKYSDSYDVPVLTAGKTFVLGYTDEKSGIFSELPVIIFDDFTTANKYVTFPFKAKSSAMKMLRPKNKEVNLRFVFEKMQLIDFKLGDHKRYWISEYQNIEVEMPKPDEQEAIASVLSDMDNEIAELEARLEKTRDLRQGMMQQLLTGSIRLV